MPLPRSLAHIKREISTKKWDEARQWAGKRILAKKYRMPRKQQPDKTVAGRNKRVAARFYQIKTGHCLTGQYLEWTKNRASAQCWWCSCRKQTREHVFKNCRRWKEQQKVLWKEAWKETGRGKSRLAIRDLLADDRCSRAVLDFLATTEIGRLVPAEEDAQSEASEWELREQREREEERGAEAERLGAEVEEPLFLPRPAFMVSARKRSENGFGLSFICHFLGAPFIFLGQAWADDKGKLATCRHRADTSRETAKNVRRHSLDRLHASMIKQKKMAATANVRRRE